MITNFARFLIKLRMQNNRNFPKIILLVSVLVGLFAFQVMLTGCGKDEPSPDPGLKLSFSTDTLRFDTVFTTVGSITREFRVYNKTDKKLRVSNIILANGSSSPFIINLDGQQGIQFKDVEIDAGDSLFVFVKLRIDPNDNNNPFEVRDSVVFETNGNLQHVKLLAWGRNAWFHTPDIFQEGLPPYSIIDCSKPWTADKPHVIYGWAVVDSASTLTIESGTEVYFHKDALLLVYRGGSLKVLGEPGREVIFRNDRLDEFYKDLPGQWNGIWLSKGSKENFINHAVILNGNLGIQVDFPEDYTQPQLYLANTRIGNMKTGGLAINGSVLQAVNLVIENCGSYALAFGGGLASFAHLTIGNYWTSSVRQTPSLVLKNYFLNNQGEITFVEPSEISFVNSVVYGNQGEELLIDGKDQGHTFNISLDRCWLKTYTQQKFPELFNECVFNTDPQFLDTHKPLLEPDTLSPLLGAGKPIGVNSDIKGRPRSQEAPAIGAYEPVYQTRVLKAYKK